MDILIRARGIYDSETQSVSGFDGLLVKDGRIAAIGMYGALRESLPDIPVFDWSDCLLFPGLVNTHVHLEFTASERARQDFLEGTPGTRLLTATKNAQTLLRSGVTTIRDAGSSWQALDLKHPQVEALFELPRMQLAGPPLTVTGGHLHFLGEETDGMEDMIRQVRIRQKRGCDAVKLIVTGGQMTPGSLPERTSFTTQEIRAVVNEAHLLGLRAFAHCLTMEGLVRCMDGGVDCIEHAACFVRNKENQLLERVYEPERMAPFRRQRREFMMGLATGYHNLDAPRLQERPATASEAFFLKQEERMFVIFRRLIELGLQPVCGTDAGTSGTRFDETWLEPALMVERGGLTCAQAVQVATQHSAACLGLENETGRLVVGLSADIIALDGDPLADIRALGRVRHVVCRGRVVER